MRALIVVTLAALACVPMASAATRAPDAHDRALAHQLAAKVTGLQKLRSGSTQTDDRLTRELKGCKGLGTSPGQSFAVVFAMLPVLLIDLVNEIRPIILDVRSTVGAMHPHAPLFRRWLAAETANIDQILAFDNHGKKIDYCAAAKVMLAKNASDAQVQAVLGLPLSKIKALFSGASSQNTATLKKLNPPMRAFLIAAGVRRSVAVQLTK